MELLKRNNCQFGSDLDRQTSYLHVIDLSDRLVVIKIRILNDLIELVGENAADIDIIGEI